MRFALIACAVGLSLMSFGCRGNKSDVPPVHPNLNMDFQQRFEAQSENPWFADKSAMRPPVEGTVARGALRADASLHQGRGPDGRLIDALPASIKLDDALLKRGEDRYDIYCTPCHAKSGYGDGVVALRGLLVAPPSYQEPRLRAMPLGYFYDVITNGKGTMQPYAAQLNAEDRWAVAAWVRVLQASHRTNIAEIPAAHRGELK